MTNILMKANKINPWLAAGLSWAFPGLGQYCVGNSLRASIFLVLFLLLDASFLFSILLPSTLTVLSVYSLLFIYKFIMYTFCISAGIDAFICSKRLHYDNWQSLDNKRWFAIFLSLIWPGLGHAYLKRWFICTALSMIYILLFLSNGYLLRTCRTFLWIIACLHIGNSFVDAATKRILYKYIISIFLIIFVMYVVLPVLRARYIINGDFAEGMSMASTIKEDDIILVNRLAYTINVPHIGDIVQINGLSMANRLDPAVKRFLKLDRLRNYKFIKRIIAFGGDTVQIRNDGLYVNDILQKHITINHDYGPRTININGSRIERMAIQQPYIVPNNSYFVIGDNIKNSVDSRDFGAVPRNMIIGKIIKVYSSAINTSTHEPNVSPDPYTGSGLFRR